MFTILHLLCLCRNREYCGSFQNKSVSSSFKCLPKYILSLVKLKWEERPFWRWTSIDVSSKLSLACGGNVNYYQSVHHPFHYYSVCGNREQQFSKQVSKLSFQLSVQLYSLLAKLKTRRRPFLESARRGKHSEITPMSI